MTTFEYATEILNSDHEKKLNQALQKRGSEGWELVSTVAVGLTHTRLFFKRAVVSNVEAV
ncbi:MAG: hypothetical protein ACU0B9_19220 [Limimaricola soesokkakensis]|uniref:hypothetical protein n=1 Tax=Limimaricola soesokkakensis TaxID=1343159 RepID=UPI0040583202